MLPRTPWHHAAAWLLALGATAAGAFDLQGHRGARGLAPENTLAGFERALKEGVTSLELDVHLTADDVLVVHHDPALHADLARDASGAWLAAARGPLLRSLRAEQLRAYDVGRVRAGSPTARNFPQQQPADGQRVPTLAAVFEQAKALKADDVRFNIEVKLDPRHPDEYAGAEALARAVVAEVERAGMAQRVMIQSFDWEVMKHSQRLAPQVPTGYLTIQRGNNNNVTSTLWTAGINLTDHGSAPRMVKAAGGAIWTPNFGDLSAAAVKEAQALGLKVIPWTVNEPADMARLIGWGVDGLITDYPDRARTVMKERGLALPKAAGG